MTNPSTQLGLKPMKKGKPPIPAKPLGVLRLAAAFPVSTAADWFHKSDPGRQQAAALRGRLRREMTLTQNTQEALGQHEKRI